MQTVTRDTREYQFTLDTIIFINHAAPYIAHTRDQPINYICVIDRLDQQCNESNHLRMLV